MRGKGLPFALAHRWRSAGLHAAGAQIVHEVAHVKQRPDVGGRKPFAAVAEDVAAFPDDFGGERQVAGDHQIAGCLLYTSPSPRDRTRSRMPSSA